MDHFMQVECAKKTPSQSCGGCPRETTVSFSSLAPWLLAALSFFVLCGAILLIYRPVQNIFITPEGVLLQGLPLAAALISTVVLTSQFLLRMEKGIGILDVRFNAAIWGLGGLVFALCLLVNRFVLLGFMNSADEHSCRFFAPCLACCRAASPVE